MDKRWHYAKGCKAIEEKLRINPLLLSFPINSLPIQKLVLALPHLAMLEEQRGREINFPNACTCCSYTVCWLTAPECTWFWHFFYQEPFLYDDSNWRFWHLLQNELFLLRSAWVPTAAGSSQLVRIQLSSSTVFQPSEDSVSILNSLYCNLVHHRFSIASSEQVCWCSSVIYKWLKSNVSK